MIEKPRKKERKKENRSETNNILYVQEHLLSIQKTKQNNPSSIHYFFPCLALMVKI